ncbi:Transcription factor bHLH162 [Linum perenne]
MENNNNPASCSRDRKTIERNRRNQMKELYSNLSSLVLPHHHSSKAKCYEQEPMALHDQLDQAAKYIKKLQTNLEKMRVKKEKLTTVKLHGGETTAISGESIRPPRIEIKEMGSALEVVLVTGLDSHFVFNETIRVIQEEGGEVVNASFSVAEDLVFHTIHSQVHYSCRNEVVARISERLKKFVGEYGG